MPRHTLGDLQHAIMGVLWSAGEATTAEVHEALREERGLAPCTGTGMGIDRLMMALTGLGIRETVLFPIVRKQAN